MRTFRTAALAMALPGALAVAAPAAAAPQSHAVSTVAHETLAERFEHSRDRYRDRYYEDERYGRRYYDEPLYHNSRVWRGRDGRYYCRKRNGTTGLIVGGAAGALIGREIAGRGDRTLGALLGGAGGALLGREIERSGSRCR